MLCLDEIRDPELLRQVAVLLERENEKLHTKVQTLAAELARLRGDVALSAQHELEFLKELLAQRERALFSASSERRPRAEAMEPHPPPASPRGHGPTAQPKLPIVEMVHELDAADRTCPQCGGTLREMPRQTEDSEEITVVERRFVLVQHRRKKYRCACNGCIDTAPGPLRLATRPDTRGRRYAPAFAVEVAVNKYVDHLPLERQARIMSREGLTIESQTLWDQIEALATVLQPTYDALRRYVLTAPAAVGADETWWRLLGGPQRTRWWAWRVTCDDAVTYTILDSRSQDAARQVLDGYHGIVLADGYGAYAALARASPGFKLAHCWAHVRRKFVEAEPHYPEPGREGLELIGQLYAVERTCPGSDAGVSEDVAEALALRATARREQSAAIVDAIRAWALRQRALPESSLGKATAYMLGLWAGLTRFLDDARIALDNNVTERGLRGMVVGRKNHYGSRSKRGTEVAALFYSLMESAKLCGVEPKAYLLCATRAALENPGTVTLPHALLDS